MDIDAVIAALDAEWDHEQGFFGNLRGGTFDHNGLTRVLGLLRSINIAGVTTIDRRLVELTWYMPLFMTWQRERVAEAGGDVVRLDKAINEVQGLLEDILGVP